MNKGDRSLLKNWSHCRKTANFITLMRAVLMNFIIANTDTRRAVRKYTVRSAVKSLQEQALSPLNTTMKSLLRLRSMAP